MKAAHGTTRKITSFKLFDYKIDINTDTVDNENVSEGLDAYGPGVYLFNNLNDDDLLKNAQRYTSREEQSYVYIVDVDVEPENLLNNFDNEYFNQEDLVNMVELYMENEREKLGFDFNKINNVIDSVEDSFEHIRETKGTVSLDVINKNLEINNLKFRLNEYSNPNEFDDFHEWKDQVFDQYYLDEPCSKINDEGGPEALVNYCVHKADNAWEVINNLFLGIATHASGKYAYSNNETFQETVLRELSQYEIVGAQVEDCILVVFDTDKINITEEISIEPKRKRKYTNTI